MPGVACAVYSCKNYRIKTIKNKWGKKILYHGFPKGNDLATIIQRQIWVQRCYRRNQFNPDTSKICSVHFKDSAYKRDLRNELLGLPVRRFLKKDAVPTENLPDNMSNNADDAEINIRFDNLIVPSEDLSTKRWNYVDVANVDRRGSSLQQNVKKKTDVGVLSLNNSFPIIGNNSQNLTYKIHNDAFFKPVPLNADNEISKQCNSLEKDIFNIERRVAALERKLSTINQKHVSVELKP